MVFEKKSILKLESNKVYCLCVGGWEGSASFEFVFKKGGAIDIGKKLMELATQRNQFYQHC